MFRSVQRGIASGLLLSSLLCALAAGSPIRVTPLVDRPGQDTYCGAVTGLIERAETSIDLLLSGADVEGVPLWEPIVEAARRGVAVRVLLDASDWAPDITADNRLVLSYLTEHGIDCRFDDPAVTTHAKLLIVDRSLVVLGSTNWNEYAFREHDQANVLVEGEALAAVYAEYFDRLWDGRLAEEGVELDLAGIRDEDPTLVPLPDGPGTSLYVRLLLELLPRARRSVHVAMYRISVYPSYPGSLANALVDALVGAAGRGLDVRVLIDDCRYYADSADANLASAITLFQRGVDVRFDAPERTTHAKLVVIDGESVVLGSTNWNYYALEQNVETSLGLLHMPAVAGAFDAFFEAAWSEGRSIGPEAPRD